MVVDMRDMEDRLLQRRIVALGHIDEKEASRVGLNLLRLQLASSDPAYLVISSTGGSLDAAMSLCDTIQYAFEMPVHALVDGHCASAATFILLACKERLAMPHCRFLIHSGMVSGISLRTDDVTERKVERLLQETKKTTEMVIDFYADKLKKSRSEIKELIARGDEQFDNYLSAAEALEIGLITSIVNSKLGLFPPPPPQQQSG